MISKKNLELLISCLHLQRIDGQPVTEETLLADLKDYDSMFILEIIVFFSDNCGKELDIAEVRKLKTVKELVAFME